MDPSWILAELPELQITQCDNLIGAVAQLGEHLLCKQGVTGSIPVSSTILFERHCFKVDVLRGADFGAEL